MFFSGRGDFYHLLAEVISAWSAAELSWIGDAVAEVTSASSAAAAVILPRSFHG